MKFALPLSLDIENVTIVDANGTQVDDSDLVDAMNAVAALVAKLADSERQVAALRDVLAGAQHELRLCREKDGAGPYDVTLKSRMATVANDTAAVAARFVDVDTVRDAILSAKAVEAGRQRADPAAVFADDVVARLKAKRGAV